MRMIDNNKQRVIITTKSVKNVNSSHDITTTYQKKIIIIEIATPESNAADNTSIEPNRDQSIIYKQ